MKTMKKLFLLIAGLLAIISCPACTGDDAEKEIDHPGNATEENGGNATTGTTDSNTPMSGKVNLWEKGNIPTVTHNVNNSDGPDFIPNMEVFTIAESTAPKGAVIICPGGAFMFRSMQNEGYDVANMLTAMGYQCFIVNYRISPYTMRESATDLSRAIRLSLIHI